MVKINALKCTILGLTIYLFQNILFGLLIGTFNIGSNISQIISYLFSLLLITILVRNKECASYFGFCKIKKNIKIMYLIPMFFIPIINLIYLSTPDIIITQNIFMCIASGIYIGIIEELIFRSFLFRTIEERINYGWAIIISSIIFGLFHLVNLNSLPIQIVILQVIYATAIGSIFSIIFYITQSLFPCIIVHTLTNITGFIFTENLQFKIELMGTGIIICITIFYTVLLKKHIKTENSIRPTCT